MTFAENVNLEVSIVQHRASNIIDLVVTASNVGQCSDLFQKWAQHAYDFCIPIQGSTTSHARKNLTSNNVTPPPFFIFVSQHLRNGPNPVYNAIENPNHYHRRCRYLHPRFHFQEIEAGDQITCPLRYHFSGATDHNTTLDSVSGEFIVRFPQDISMR